MAVVRPYLKLGIADLESIFEAAGSEAEICQALVDELQHRSTERSGALLARVQGALSQKEAGAPLSASDPGCGLAGRLAPASATMGAAASVRTPSLVGSEVEEARTVAPSAVTNKPAAILSAWTALEALSPQTYRRPADLVNGDNRCVAPFEGDDLPWFRREPSRRNYQLYYQVILGCVPVDRATNELIRAFGEDEERGRKEREKAALAAVLVDRNGIPLEENAVGVSRFGWALPRGPGGARGLDGGGCVFRRT